MVIFALILSMGVGFGLSCLFFASLLSKSNDIGNSVGAVSRYAERPVFDRSPHRISSEEEKEFIREYIKSDEYFKDELEKAKSEPDSAKPLI